MQERMSTIVRHGGISSPPQVDRLWDIWRSCIRYPKQYSVYLRGTIITSLSRKEDLTHAMNQLSDARASTFTVLGLFQT